MATLNETVRTRAADARVEILALLERLEATFVGRGEVLRAAVIALAADEPMLLVGPPGVAKSAVVRALASGLGVRGADYFEYLVHAYTEPWELVGPIDVQSLRESGRYRRRLDGRLPAARLVFLDEVFNGGSAILNTLLGVLNERHVHDGERLVPLERLGGFFGATNAVADDPQLAAFRDRFSLCVEVAPVGEDALAALMVAGARLRQAQRDARCLWERTGGADLESFKSVREHLDGWVARHLEDGARALPLPPTVHRRLTQLVVELRSRGVALSDRAVVKAARLAMFHAYLLDGREPDGLELADLGVLRWVVAPAAERALARACVDRALDGAEEA